MTAPSDETDDSASARGAAPRTPQAGRAPSLSLVPLCPVVDDIESNMVLGLLRSEGVEALATANLDPSIYPTGTSDSSFILVLEQDLQRARRILDEHRLTTFAVAVILAAGEGRRMGRPKGLLPVRGRSLVEELCDAYSASLVREIVVVTAPDSLLSAVLDTNLVTVVENPDPGRGPLSSLWVALDAIEDAADALLLQPVDVPMFDSGLVSALVRRYDAGQGPILVPTYQGRRGHPVLFGKQCFPLLRQAPLEVGARHVLHGNPALVCEVPTTSSSVVVDLNTPEDFQDFLRKDSHRMAGQ